MYVAVLHLHQSHHIKELSSGYCSMTVDEGRRRLHRGADDVVGRWLNVI